MDRSAPHDLLDAELGPDVDAAPLRPEAGAFPRSTIAGWIARSATRTLLLVALAFAAWYLLVEASGLADRDRRTADALRLLGAGAICLTAQCWLVHQRRRAAEAHRRALAEVQGRLRALAEGSGHFTVVLDAGDRIGFVNRAVEDVVGLGPADLLGEPLSRLLPADDGPAMTRALADVRRDGQGARRTLAHRVRRADGGVRAVQTVLVNHLETASVHGVVANVHDVEELRDHERLITSLLSGSATIAAVRTVEDVAEALLQSCLLATGAEYGTVRELDEAERTLVLRAIHRGPFTPRMHPLSLDGPSLAARAVRTGRVVALESAEELAHLPAGAVPDGVSCAVYVPLNAGGRCVGVVGLVFTDDHRVNRAARDVLVTFSRQAAVALERVRQRDALQTAVIASDAAAARAQALHRVSGALSRALRVDDVIEVAVDAIATALEPLSVAAMLSDGDRFEVVAHRGLFSPRTPRERGVDVPPSYHGPVLATLRDGRARWYERLAEGEAEFGLLSPSEADALPWRAGAAVPLVVDGATVGLLACGFGTERRWHPEERTLLETTAALCSEAMVRARRFEEAQEAAERYAQLFGSYEQLFRNHPLPMIVYDESDFSIRAANTAMVEAFGYRVDELCRMSALDLLDREEAQRARDFHASDAFDRHGLNRLGLLRMYTRDGRRRIVDATCHEASRFTDGPARVALFVDQTARVQAEEERRRLEVRMVTVAEEERKRVAEDLHDGPVQQLAVASMRLSALRSHAHAGREIPPARIQTIESDVNATVGELRTMMSKLYPPTFDEMAVGEAIRHAVDESPVLAELDVRVLDDLAVQPSPAVKTAIYRVAIEALTNVHKHAAATSAFVRLRPWDGGVELAVIDDGIGIDDTSPVPVAHLGLMSMHDRVAMLGGTCTVSRLSSSGGTQVRAHLPDAASATT